MKRVLQVTSSEKRSNRSAAAGSRSMQIMVPSSPSMEATRRAWPPAPKVQSTATWPGCGASRSMSSVARTGLCSLGMTTRLLLSASGLRAGAARSVPATGGIGRSSICVSRPLARISLDPPRGQALGDLRGRGVELFLLLGPCLCIPDLQVLAGADHDAGAGEAGVVDQWLRQADAARRVELVVEGAAVEAAPQAAGVLAEWAVGGQEAVGELF